MRTIYAYTVQPGDTLFGLARRFHMSVDEIRRLNNLLGDLLRIGQEIRVLRENGQSELPVHEELPSSSRATTAIYTVMAGDTLFALARRFNTTVDQIKAMNGLTSNSLSIGQVLRVPGGNTTPTKPPVNNPPDNRPPSGNTGAYTVVAGDSLYAISRRFNMTVDQLIALNGLTSTSLRIGQVLKVRQSTWIPPTDPLPPSPPPPVEPLPQPPVNEGDYLAARRQFGLEVRPEGDFRRYRLTVPLLSGQTVLASLRDNVTYSQFMVYPEGLVYGGQSSIPLSVDMIESVGLNESQARALQYVSTHEGKFDAINSYDQGIFSYGFIQFVGAAAIGSSLSRLLNSMRQQAPDRFARVFQKVGIDVEMGVVTVLDEQGQRLRADEAFRYIQRTVPLYGAFIQAGFDSLLVREQLRMANELYVQPALNFSLNLNINGIALRIPRLRDVFRSEGLLTIVIAVAISRGVGGMSRIVADALSLVAAQHRASDLAAVQEVDERMVAETIARNATDTRVRDRALGVLNAGMDFSKIG